MQAWKELYYAWRLARLQDKAGRRQRQFLNPTHWWAYLTKHEKTVYVKYAIKLNTEEFDID